MKKQKPQLVDQYIEGIDPAKRETHRGVLRTLQHHKSASLSDLAEYVEFTKREYPNGLPTQRPIGDLENDGYFYFYLDEFFSCAESIQQAARILGRNRSTLNSYYNDPSFPKTKNIEGKKSIDIIATQDWIIWNTDHHAGLKPYWPGEKQNALVTMHFDEQYKDEPLFTLHHAESEAA